MKPEYPCFLTEDFTFYDYVVLTTEAQCGMMRLERPCPNEAYQGNVFASKTEASIVIPICDMCYEDMHGEQP